MSKPVDGYEGLYEVDDAGGVWTLRSGTPKPMRPSFDKDGYLQVVLTGRDGKRRRYYVHRLVAAAFIPNPDDLPQVNHLDGDKTDNRVGNLEWCDCSTNNLHSHRTGLHPTDKLTIEDARNIRHEYQKGVRGHGMRALAKKYGVTTCHICHIIQGKKLKEVMPDEAL